MGINKNGGADTVDQNESGVNYQAKRMTVYYGLLEDAKTGCQRVVTERYLDRGSCELATYAKTEPGKIEKVLIKSENIFVPTTHELLKDVYHYVMQSKLDAMTCEYCFGCSNNSSEQKYHTGIGCLDDRDVLIQSYGQKCHDTLTPQSMLVALGVMCKEFDIVNTLTIEEIVTYIQNVNFEEMLKSLKSFLYEFGKITGL